MLIIVNILPVVQPRVSAKKRKIQQEEQKHLYHEKTRIFPEDYKKNFGNEIDDPDFFHASTKLSRKAVKKKPKQKIEPQYTTTNSRGKIDCFKERDDFQKCKFN
jgi:hypothetical protein